MAECSDGSDQVAGQVGSKKMCKPCGKKQIKMLADIYCETCCEYQCRECSKSHQMFTFMEGHKLKQVNQTCVTIQSVQPVDMKGVDMCLKHQKPFQFYCVDDDLLLCNSCLISNHRKCDEILELDTESLKTSDNSSTKQDINSVLSEMKDSATTILNNAEKVKRSIGQTLEPILNKIVEKKDLIMQKFEELKVNVTEEITQHEEESERIIDEVIDTSNETLERINTLQNIHAPVLDNGTPSQKFILKHVIGKQTFKVDHEVEPWAFTFEFSSQFTELLDPETPLGTLERNNDTDTDTSTTTNPDDTTIPDLEHKEEIDVGIETTNADKDTEDDDNQTVKPNPDEDLQLVEPVTQRNEPLTLKLIHSIGVIQGPGDIREPFYSGLDFLPDGRLVVVDNQNGKLHVFDETLVRIDTFNFKGHLSSVAVLSKDQVTVTTEKFIQILKINSQSEITLSRNIMTSSPCYSICPMNATTLLVSTYRDKRPIRMIKADGEEEDFENLEQKQYGYDDSQSTYISSANMLALTDMFADTVYLYTLNGKHLTRQSITHPYILAPRGVCEGPGHSVFVCSAGTNSLVQVSTSGDVLGSHKLDMFLPYDVCMSKDGRKIAISNYYHGLLKLQIYHI